MKISHTPSLRLYLHKEYHHQWSFYLLDVADKEWLQTYVTELPTTNNSTQELVDLRR